MRQNLFFQKNATPDDLRIAWILNIFTVSLAWEPAQKACCIELFIRALANSLYSCIALKIFVLFVFFVDEIIFHKY